MMIDYVMPASNQVTATAAVTTVKNVMINGNFYDSLAVS
jgi:hypothetical protein